MEDDDTAADMAAAMGFSSFGTQNPPSKKRKYNPNTDAVFSIDESKLYGTGANSAPVAERRAPATNADEIALSDDDDDANKKDDIKGDGSPEGAPIESTGGTVHSVGAGVAGLPQRPAQPQGGFGGQQRQRSGGGPRQAQGGYAGQKGHHGINELWYKDYYDHFSNENPWAKLEAAAGLQPISTWVSVHVDTDELRQQASAA